MHLKWEVSRKIIIPTSKKKKVNLIEVGNTNYKYNKKLLNEFVNLISSGCKVHLSHPLSDVIKGILQRDFRLFIYENIVGDLSITLWFLKSRRTFELHYVCRAWLTTQMPFT